MAHYPRNKIVSAVVLDGMLNFLVVLCTTLSYYQQRRLRPLSTSYIIGNVTIGLSTVMITCWAIVSASGRFEYLKWVENPGGYQPSWRSDGMKVA